MDKELKVAKAFTKCPFCGDMNVDVSKIEFKEEVKENGAVIIRKIYPCCGGISKAVVLPKIRFKERRGTKIRFRWTGTCSKQQYLKGADYRTRILEKQGNKVTWEKKAVRRYNEVFNTVKEAKEIDGGFLERHLQKGHKLEIVPLWSYSYRKVQPEETDKELWHKHSGFGIHKVARNHR